MGGIPVQSLAFKHLNKLLCLLLCAVLLGLLCTGVSALPEERCQVLIDYRHENVTVSDASFKIYRIADLNSRQELSYVGAFSNLRFEADALADAVEELYTRVEKQNLVPERTFVTDAEGKASVSDLAPGAFLLVGEPTTVDGYVYYVDKQVVFLNESVLTLNPKSTRLPVGVKLISIKTVKFWDDNGYENERPREITVRLLKDGKTVHSVVLSEANNWSYTWNNLLPNARWTVAEDVPEGYKASIEESNHVFTVRNLYKDIPQTGQVWWPVITVLCVGLVLIVLGLSLRRSVRNEA